MLSFKTNVVLMLALICATFALSTEDSPSKTKEIPAPPTGDHSIDPGFTFSTTTAKSQGEDVYCTRIYDPICASDKKTYNNKCEFENAQRKDSKLTMVKEGEC